MNLSPLPGGKVALDRPASFKKEIILGRKKAKAKSTFKGQAILVKLI